jgi:hypothetical protein
MGSIRQKKKKSNPLVLPAKKLRAGAWPASGQDARGNGHLRAHPIYGAHPIYAFTIPGTCG